MLYYPKHIEQTGQKLIVHIPESAFFLKNWLERGEEFKGLSIRWAAGRDSQGILLVIGVRHEGRGFDIGFRKDSWDVLAQESEQLVIRSGDDYADTTQQTEIEIPEDSFNDFIENCQAQATEDSQKTVLAEIAGYFS